MKPPISMIVKASSMPTLMPRLRGSSTWAKPGSERLPSSACARLSSSSAISDVFHHQSHGLDGGDDEEELQQAGKHHGGQGLEHAALRFQRRGRRDDRHGEAEQQALQEEQAELRAVEHVDHD